MKTYILQLEPHDDIVSVRDKMQWAKNSRILVVWPETSDLLNRRLELVLLFRASQALGAQLALVSQDPEVRYQALHLGIPIFKNLRQGQSRAWRLPFRFRRNPIPNQRHLLELAQERETREKLAPPEPQNAPKNPLQRLFFFALGVISLLTIAGLLAPSAVIALTPKILVQDVLIDVIADDEVNAVTISGIAPTETVTILVEGRGSRKTSGVIRLPDQPARGRVVFTNLTDQSVLIPAGSGMQPTTGNRLRYITTAESQVPAGPGQSVEVSVRCEVPGEAGNLPPGALVAIEGILGMQLSVSNPEAISGGSERREPAPNIQDRQQLAEELHSALQETAQEEIEKTLQPGDLIIPSSLQMVEVVEENFLPALQQPADLLTLSTRLKFQAQVIKSTDLRRLAEVVFDANLPAGFSVVPNSLQIDVIAAPALTSNGQATLKLHAVRRLRAQITPAHAIQEGLGMPPALAAERLSAALPLEETPQISLQPSWWPRLPFLPFRITIIDQNQSGADEETTGL